jgi:hypothetical protein
VGVLAHCIDLFFIAGRQPACLQRPTHRRPNPPVYTAVVTPDSHLGVRDSCSLTAVAEDATGQALRDRPIPWSSSDIDCHSWPGGRIKAMNRGVASAIALSEGKSDSRTLVTFPFGGPALVSFHCDLKPSIRPPLGPQRGLQLATRSSAPLMTPVPVEGTSHSYRWLRVATTRAALQSQASLLGGSDGGQVGINYAAPK